MMHSSRATDRDKPVHSPMTSLVTSDQSRILKGTDHSLLRRIKGEKGSFFFYSPRSRVAVREDKVCLARDGMPTCKAPVKENIRKSVRKCFL